MGLVRGVAKTAVVAGTATAVSNRVSRRQYNRWAQQGDPYAQEPQPAPQQAPQQYAPAPQYAQAPPPSSGGGDDRIQKLKDLAELKAQGVLTEEEFAAEKARILNS